MIDHVPTILMVWSSTEVKVVAGNFYDSDEVFFFLR